MQYRWRVPEAQLEENSKTETDGGEKVRGGNEIHDKIGVIVCRKTDVLKQNRGKWSNTDPTSHLRIGAFQTYITAHWPRGPPLTSLHFDPCNKYELSVSQK